MIRLKIKDIKDFFRQYKIEIILFSIGSLVRLFFLFLSLHARSYDYNFMGGDGYYEIGRNLWRNGFFSNRLNAPFILDPMRTPGLPYLISFFLFLFKTPLVFLIFQVLFSGFLQVIGFKIARFFGLSVLASFLICLFWIIDPLSISLSIRMITETFFTLFFLLFVFFVTWIIKSLEKLNYHNFVLAGLSLGLATLFKPTTLYFAVLLSIVWLLDRLIKRRSLFLKQIFVFLFCVYIVTVPWFLHNFKIYGIFNYSTAKEQVMYSNLIPSIWSYKNNESYDKSLERLYLSDGFQELSEVAMKNTSWFRTRVVEEIKKNPKEFLEVGLVSTMTFFTHDGSLDLLMMLKKADASTQFPHGLSFFHQPFSKIAQSLFQLAVSPFLLVLFFRLIWVGLTFLFLSGIVFFLVNKRNDLLAWFFLICILYFSLTTISNGLTVNGRFRFPVDILILCFVVWGIKLFSNLIHKPIRT